MMKVTIMTKIAIITDLHLGYHENTNQSKMMYDYLKNFFDFIHNQNIQNIFILGDIFDNRENINFLTIKNTKESFIDPILKYGLNVYITAGNHDCYYKNTNDIYSVELLFDHVKNLHLIKNYGENIIIGNTNILMIPWINSQNYEQNMNLINNSNADYLMGHFEINGFTMVKGIKCSNGLSKDIFKRFKKVFSGHFHLRENIGNIYYVGTPYEKDWNDKGFDKGFDILDLETGNIEFIKNPNNYFEIIEYNNGLNLDKIENLQNKEIKLIINSVDKQSKLNETLNELYKINVSKLQIIDNTTIVEEKENLNESNEITNLKNDNLEIFKKYIKNLNLDENIDKNKLNELLISTYNESLGK